MRKLILCLSVITILVLSGTQTHAKLTANHSSVSVPASEIESYIAFVYGQIDFGKKERLSYDVFNTAYHGYLNLRNAGKLNTHKNLLTICDFTQSSSKTRLWVIDLNEKKLIMNDFVAHGQGSGEEFAKAFSNKENSHQSSLGFYVTGETYEGEHGTSLRLDGMDNGFNSAAYDRAIVVHGADYVSPQFISSQKRLGRSWGCPAVSSKIADKLINTIKDGTCLFIYYPQKKYLASAYWINKKIDHLPEDYMMMGLQNPSCFAANAAKQAPVYFYTPETEYLNPACKVSQNYLAAHIEDEIVMPEAPVAEPDNVVIVPDLSFVHGILP